MKTSAHVAERRVSNQMTGQTPQEDPSPGIVVSLRDLDVEFAGADGVGRRVIDGVHLDIPRGQFIALVGHSGGGKTTILNTINGLIEPTGGRVSVLGTDPVSARARMSLIPARDALLPWRSAIRNVEYGLEIRGVSKAERRARARKYLDLLGLSDAADRWPWQLSQGMRQRVALARAWALEPELLLMDEPFAALDAETREIVRSEFRSLLDDGANRTVVLVTHDLEEAALLADRVVVLSGGRLAEDFAVPAELRADPEAVEHAGVRAEFVRRLRTALRHAD